MLEELWLLAGSLHPSIDSNVCTTSAAESAVSTVNVGCARACTKQQCDPLHHVDSAKVPTK